MVLGAGVPPECWQSWRASGPSRKAAWSVVYFQVQRKRKGSRAANISTHTLDEKSHFCCSDGEPGAIFSCSFFPFFKQAGWSLCSFPTSNCKTQELIKKASFFCERSYQMCPPRKTGASDQFGRRSSSSGADIRSVLTLVPGLDSRHFSAVILAPTWRFWLFFSSEEEMLKERKWHSESVFSRLVWRIFYRRRYAFLK